MARGATAKQNVENIIRNAFGADFIGISDKKLYVAADDGGEKVQICLSLTCPKVPLGANANEGLDFENMPDNITTGTEHKTAEITSEETENIRKILAQLGL
jgi:hypothetical protein